VSSSASGAFARTRPRPGTPWTYPRSRYSRTKRLAGIDSYDPEREATVVGDAATQAILLGLDAEQVRELFWRIVRISREAASREER
jgi:hypothetical protein